MAHALFFGRLRDVAGCSRRDVRVDDIVAIDEFRRLVAGEDRDLEAALAAPSVRVAVNAVMAPASRYCMVRPGDEVAFMPPFSGG
jgi:molybdopterin converting factor small subunit